MSIGKIIGDFAILIVAYTILFVGFIAIGTCYGMMVRAFYGKPITEILLCILFVALICMPLHYMGIKAAFELYEELKGKTEKEKE